MCVFLILLKEPSEFQVLATSVIYPVAICYYMKNMKLCKSVFSTNLSNIDKVTKFRIHYSVVNIYWAFGTLLVSAYTTAFANLFVWIRYEEQNVPIREILEKISTPS